MKKLNEIINNLLLLLGMSMMLVGLITLYAINENLLKTTLCLAAIMLIIKIQIVSKSTKTR